ncbi:MAG: 30S ribosomal protein S19 [Candidatus Altiarchaeota archaeon]|nr:30S ribosomal protein S19 [Candidatus Altiarchaeota archaeon]
MAKEFKYRGIGEEELKKLKTDEFIAIAPSRIKRSLKRGLTDKQKKLLDKIKKRKSNPGKPVKTHCTDMPILPEMADTTIMIHNGKEFIPINVTIEMIGHYLGEYVQTRKRIQHSAPGVGATRSSKFVPLR